MSLLSANIPNLVGGVSQQPAAIRRENQTESQTNAYATLVEGLTPRRPTYHVAKIITSAVGAGGFWHVINRDLSERYVVVINNGTLRVFELDTGVERIVSFPDGFGYLTATTTAKKAFRAISVSDYTFISNVERTVAMDTTLSAKSNPTALINVKQGNYAKTYSITINGAGVASYATPDGSVSSHGYNIDTSYIAGQLAAGLAASLPTWTVTQYASSVHIVAPTSTDFSISCADGYSGLAMICLKGETQRFSDLPTVGPEGFVIGISGDKGVKGDLYYLKYVKNLTADGTGVWKETIAPGIKHKLDLATMPWQLVRNSDGSFTFKKAAWIDRLVGDETTNPNPSFVGRKISDVYFSRNRLGFTAGENSIASRSGEFFNFFRRTVTTLLDDDPVDVSVTSVRVSSLKHAVPFNKTLILFAEQGQHELGSNGPLTPKSAAVVPTSEYEAAALPRPSVTGTSVFFAVEQDGFTQLREYYTDGNTGTKNTAFNTTEHCPRYIPEGTHRIHASRSEDTVAVLTDGDPNSIYVYRYLGDPENRAQSAWTKWDLGGPVRYCEFIKADLYCFVERDNAMWIEKIPLAAGKVDTGVNYLTLLDRRVPSTSLTIAPIYDAVAQRTTFYLPYDAAGAKAVVMQSNSYAGPLQPGLLVDVWATSGIAIILKGDHRTTPLLFGFTYETRIELSAIFPRETKGSKGSAKTTVIEGRLQLRYLTLMLGNTSNLRVEVTPLGRSTSTKVFNGWIVGNAQSLLGVVPQYNGKLRVPVMSRSSTTRIVIVHDSHLPMSVLAMEWEGLFALRSGRSP